MAPEGKPQRAWAGPALAAALLLALPLRAPGATELKALGLIRLPRGSQELGPLRYRSGLNYQDSLHYFRRFFRGNRKVEQIPIVNLPGIHGVHFANHAGEKRRWDGINLYELQGDVRIVVLEHRSQTPAAAGSTPASPRAGNH